MTINCAINTAIDFCKEELIPSKYTIKNTALYALGGFLSGKVFGFISPMHGAIYLATSTITYVAIHRINFFAYRIAGKTTAALSRKIKPTFELCYNSKQESSFSSCVKSGRRLVSSWVDSLESNLGFIRGMPLTYTNIYLSHHMANAAALSLLNMQPIAYRAAIKIVCSSAILTIFAGSIIDFCHKKAKKL
ncbi:MAG TPA: hypothetical protein VGZ69_03550, partial [Candidatus Rhabdochlamydia sp.]|nr:hypothetical protein [Candidatus Rhabdochlamydia sp.]